MQRFVVLILGAVLWAGATAGAGAMFANGRVASVSAPAKTSAQQKAQTFAERFSAQRVARRDLSAVIATSESVRWLSDAAKPRVVGKKAAALALAPPPAAPKWGELQATLKDLLGHEDFALFDSNGNKVAGTLFSDETNLRQHPDVRRVMFGLEHVAFVADSASDEVGVPVAGADGRAIGALFVRQKLAQACGVVPDDITVMFGKQKLCGKVAGSAALVAGFAPSAASASPLFVEPSGAGQWTEGLSLDGGVVILATANNHNEWLELAAAQRDLMTAFGASFVLVALLILLAFHLGQRPATALSNQVSLALQNNGTIDENAFSEPWKRLAKNILQLQHRGGVRGSIDSPNVSSLLGGNADSKHDSIKEESVTDTNSKSNQIDRVSFPDKVEAKGKPKGEAPKEPEAKPAAPKFGDFDDSAALSALDDAEEAMNGSANKELGAIAAATAVSGPSSIAPTPPAPPDDEEEGKGGVAAFPSSKSLSANSLFDSQDNAADEPTRMGPPPAPADAEVAGNNDSKGADKAALSALFEDGEPQQQPPPAADAQNSRNEALQMLTQSTPADPVRAAGSSPWEPAGEDAPASDEDPDEAHFHEVYENFVRARTECGEQGELPYPKFVEKLKKSREQVMQKQSCKSVRFQVYVKDGKAALKAVAFR